MLDSVKAAVGGGMRRLPNAAAFLYLHDALEDETGNLTR
jgi:hypothetical protein